MRISYVTETYPPEINGVALTVERSVRYLRERGHAVDLIRPHQPIDRTLSARAAVPTQWLTAGLPIPFYRNLRFGLALPATVRQRLQHTRAQLVHVATPGPLGWAAVQAARQLELPVTGDFRTNFHSYSQFYRLGVFAPTVSRYLRWLHNRMTLSFVPLRSTQQQLEAEGYERLEVVGRGVDAERYSPVHRDAALRAAWGADDATPVLLYVGRLAREKNVELALRAYAKRRAQEPATRMVVVGDGPQRARLQAAYPDVHFAGMQQGAALARHYASADVFMFPSLTETFGNVTLEALASGLAVVSYDRAAAGAHIRDGHSGWLAPAGDEAAFIAAACKAEAHSPAAMQLRAEARAAAQAADWPGVLGDFNLHLARAATARGTKRATHVAVA